MQIRNLYFFVLLLSGCVSPAVAEFGVYDPGEAFNRKMYVVGEKRDNNIFIPVAKSYKKITPDLVETAVTNFFTNIRNLDSAVNGFLQGKVTSGVTDIGRVIVNSTLGVVGLFDVATKMGLQHQHEDFGQTLAVWGVKKTRYVFIPVLGPTSLRDMPAVLIDLLLPRALLGDVYSLGVAGLDIVDRRAVTLDASHIRDSTALDPYAFTREAYFQRRRYLIFAGAPPLEEFDANLFIDSSE
jgi:phospholipid-binding lipoprotein MlaA